MNLEFGLTDSQINTQYAPLAALSAHYQHKNMLEPLIGVSIAQKKRDFTPTDKLLQAWLSVLAGCKSQSEINVHLKHEIPLAHVWYWDRFADQSGIARTLDMLSLKQIEQLRTATTAIWRRCSQTRSHAMTGAVTCGWTSIYPVYHAENTPKRVCGGILAAKKRHGTAISAGKCDSLP